MWLTCSVFGSGPPLFPPCAMETDRNMMRSVDALRICMGLVADLEIAALQPVRTTINVHPEPVHTRELGGIRCCGGASRFCFNRCRHGGKRGLLQLRSHRRQNKIRSTARAHHHQCASRARAHQRTWRSPLLWRSFSRQAVLRAVFEGGCATEYPQDLQCVES